MDSLTLVEPCDYINPHSQLLENVRSVCDEGFTRRSLTLFGVWLITSASVWPKTDRTSDDEAHALFATSETQQMRLKQIELETRLHAEHQ